jgi:hypothetical protein
LSGPTATRAGKIAQDAVAKRTAVSSAIARGMRESP